MDAIHSCPTRTAVIPTASGHEVLVDSDLVIPGSVSIGSHGYAQVTRVRPGSVVLLHRWILDIYDAGPRVIGDHINGNPLDCRRSNLRVVTASQSSANVTGRAASGYRGVYPNKSRWSARAKFAGRIHNLGTYDTPEEAATISHAWRVANLPGYVDRAALAF